MPQISNGPISLANLTAPGVYVQVIAPSAQIPGVATNVVGVVGTASWGPKGVPVLLGSPQDLQAAFGPIIGSPAPVGAVAASANPYDLVSACSAVFSQGPVQVQAVRVSDGTDVAATLVLNDTTATPVHGGTVTALHTGSLGNGIKITIATAAKTDASSNVYFNVTVAPPAGSGLQAEFYPNIKGGVDSAVNSPFWANLAAAWTSGIPGVTGPSQLVSLATPSATAENPAVLAATSMAGGVDGTATAATIIAAAVGSISATPQTGIFALSTAVPKPAIAVIAGFGATASDGDIGTYAATLATFADSTGTVVWFDYSLGDSSAAAVTETTVTQPVVDYNMNAVKDWAWWNDGVSGLRFYPMAPFMAGLQASLPPWVSPLNRPIKGISGTYRSTGAGKAAYSWAEIGDLNANGISLVAAPSPGGSYVGVNAAVNTSFPANPATGPCEYSTLTNFLARSIASAMGGVVGQNQSNSPVDPLRKLVRDKINGFLQGIKDQSGIDAFSVQCDTKNNPPNLVAAHIMQASCKVTYLASVWYFVVSLIGGTTVVVQVSQGS